MTVETKNVETMVSALADGVGGGGGEGEGEGEGEEGEFEGEDEDYEEGGGEEEGDEDKGDEDSEQQDKRDDGKKLEPFEVPKSGRFFLHDDRTEGSPAEDPREDARPRKKLWSENEGKWGHDKFEQLVQEEEAESRRSVARRGRGGRGGRGGGERTMPRPEPQAREQPIPGRGGRGSKAGGPVSLPGGRGSAQRTLTRGPENGASRVARGRGREMTEPARVNAGVRGADMGRSRERGGPQKHISARPQPAQHDDDEDDDPNDPFPALTAKAGGSARRGRGGHQTVTVDLRGSGRGGVKAMQPRSDMRRGDDDDYYNTVLPDRNLNRPSGRRARGNEQAVLAHQQHNAAMSAMSPSLAMAPQFTPTSIAGNMNMNQQQQMQAGPPQQQQWTSEYAQQWPQQFQSTGAQPQYYMVMQGSDAQGAYFFPAPAQTTAVPITQFQYQQTVQQTLPPQMANQLAGSLPTGAMPFTPAVVAPQPNMGAKPAPRRYTQMSFGNQQIIAANDAGAPEGH